MNDFCERLKKKIKEERGIQVENLALGYAGERYEHVVGVIRGYDDVLAMCDSVIKDIDNGK